MQIFYAKGLQSTDFFSDKPFFVNNCGFYKDVDHDMEVNRPMGRDDYHMLLISSGEIDVGDRRLSPGQAYIFFPSSPQHYVYRKSEESEYYWLHFSGSEIADFVESFSLKEGVADVTSARVELERLIKMMMRALSEAYTNSDKFCEGLLISLLALISAPPTVSTPFVKAIKLLSDPKDDSTVEELANIYNMTPNHFIRSFKQYTGVTPGAFRKKKRMELACDMLVSTELQIGIISKEMGFDDSLYFSRAFKKFTGCSPSEYRSKNR